MEVNIDGLPGPTHHYGALSRGNLASQKHGMAISNPKAAALQGLKKMEFWMQKGIPQYFLPPHFRPNIPLLKEQLNIGGKNIRVLERAYEINPQVFSAACSSSFMWTANAATIIAKEDSIAHKLQVTPANLESFLHRSQETNTTAKLLKKLLRKLPHNIHPPLPVQKGLGDEGAANHMRLWQADEGPGLNLFCYGKHNNQLKYPARQSLASVKKLCSNMKLEKNAFLFLEQNPGAINAGVFHNDVIALSNKNVLIVHDKAWAGFKDSIKKIQQSFENRCQASLQLLTINQKQMSLNKAVGSYFFNSQLVSLSKKESLLLMPWECKSSPEVEKLLEKWAASKIPLPQLKYLNLRQSMKNGGGPACLRLRLPVSQKNLSLLNPRFQITPDTLLWLRNWVEDFYRDRLSLKDLTDPDLLAQLKKAHDKMANFLEI